MPPWLPPMPPSLYPRHVESRGSLSLANMNVIKQTFYRSFLGMSGSVFCHRGIGDSFGKLSSCVGRSQAFCCGCHQVAAKLDRQ